VHPVSQTLERGVGQGLCEPAVDHHFPQLDPKVLQLGRIGRQQRLLGRVADLA